jgi:2'-5' RNA ligase
MKLSIISYLDSDSTTQIVNLQQKLSVVTGSMSSLETWQPHITIGDGIEISHEQLAVCETKLMHVAKQNHTFNVTLRGFDGFTNWTPGAGQVGTPYVIFARIEPTKALLKLVAELERVLKDEKRWYTMPAPYKPHITLAYRDLDQAGYTRGIDLLQRESLDHTAIIDHIALVVTQDESNSELRRIMLNDPPT